MSEACLGKEEVGLSCQMPLKVWGLEALLPCLTPEEALQSGGSDTDSSKEE